MDAYWAEGRDIGDAGELRRLAREAGLDDAESRRRSPTVEAFLARVVASTQAAQQLGVNGIPAFLLDRRLLVLGAQPQEVFRQAFAQLQRGRTP